MTLGTRPPEWPLRLGPAPLPMLRRCRLSASAAAGTRGGWGGALLGQAWVAPAGVARACVTGGRGGGPPGSCSSPSCSACMWGGSGYCSRGSGRGYVPAHTVASPGVSATPAPQVEGGPGAPMWSQAHLGRRRAIAAAAALGRLRRQRLRVSGRRRSHRSEPFFHGLRQCLHHICPAPGAQAPGGMWGSGPGTAGSLRSRTLL
jgi:hypothetical protein